VTLTIYLRERRAGASSQRFPAYGIPQVEPPSFTLSSYDTMAADCTPGAKSAVYDCLVVLHVLLVHGQVTIIFVVSVGLSVCLFVCAEFFSAVFDPISISLGHMLYVWV